MVFRKANESDPRISSEVQIFIENLPKDVAIPELCQFFSSVGQIKQDRMSKQPRVWLYHDKATGQPTGECTITYRDSDTQKRALQEYNLAEFNGCTITVTPSIVKSHMAKGALPRGRGGVRGGMPRGRGRGGGGFDRSQSGGDEDYFTRRGEQSRGGFGRESNRGGAGFRGRRPPPTPEREDSGRHGGGYERRSRPKESSHRYQPY